jgi:tetratricopeptide (TPR) repeat protein
MKNTVTFIFLLSTTLLMTACFDNADKSKESIQNFLKGEANQSNYELSQKYFSEGEYEKALEFDKKQLTEDLKYYKEISIEIALDYNNIGLDYDELKNYQKALEYYEKAMKIDNVTLDLNSTERSTTYYNVASSYDALGDNKNALTYYFKALEIDKVGLGAYHGDVLSEYEDIAEVYERISNYELAVEYFTKALEFKEHEYGKEDLQTKDMAKKIEELKKKIK